MPRVTAHRVHSASIEAVRRALPVARYLLLLDQAATTGYMPRLDPATGRPIPSSTPEERVATQVAIRDRVNIAQFLVNKAMPDPRSDFLPNEESDAGLLDVTVVRDLPAAELRAALTHAQRDTTAPNPLYDTDIGDDASADLADLAAQARHVRTTPRR